MNDRLKIHKTYKLYIGGSFVRSESGRSLAVKAPSGAHLENVCLASRKDFRDAVVAARAAFDGWAKKTASLRGQILYRAAEMLQNRAAELEDEISRSMDVSSESARDEVGRAIDRLVYYAGWTDKYPQVFGSVNPVASSHFNFTTPEPTGVVVVLAPDAPSILGLVSAVAPVILAGNTAVVMASDAFPLPAASFAEILATSDLPGGVVNILTGRRADLVSHAASHMEVNAIVDASGDQSLGKALHGGTASNLKRCSFRNLSAEDWMTEKGQDPYWILDTVEFKTAWHPIGL
jgi:acyl-CoA reductase-like NAD-dependent aldehyde dehydrogenase